MQRSGGGQSRLTRLIVGVSLLAALVAIAPIVGGVLGWGTTSVRPSTAFADAPAGNYAVVTRNEGQFDVLSVVWAENPGAATEIARVPHLEGFTSTGTVSPDGTRVALVTVDAGSISRPVASLIFANLETGELFRAALAIEPMQLPAWSPDSGSVVVTRSATDGHIDVLRVSLEAKETLLGSHSGVLGVYPVGFAPDGELVQVVIDGRGSTAQKSGADVASLSPNITREWQLSPDGSEIAFIDVSTAAGLEYFARSVPLNSAGAGVSSQSLVASVSALGVAWNPANGSVKFGVEPGGASAGVFAQSLTANEATIVGFDVPLAYSADGALLAVTRWTGSDFDNPGTSSLQIVDSAGRTTLGGHTRFIGWSQR